MLEAILWHNITETNNARVVKMVKFIKTCDQYPYRFGNFFNSIIHFSTTMVEHTGLGKNSRKILKR